MTTGVTIIGGLIEAYAPLTNIVPANSMKAGRLPANITIPALLVRRTSGFERQQLKRGSVVRWVDRVSVTARVVAYRDLEKILGLVVTCCAGRVGDIGGAQRVSILNAGIGPELEGPADSFEQTQDFRVTYEV